MTKVSAVNVLSKLVVFINIIRKPLCQKYHTYNFSLFIFWREILVRICNAVKS